MNDPKSRLSYIFWGLLLTILDIEINQFDILPDVIGYGCVFLGASGLMLQSRHFLTAKNTAFILIVLSIVSYVVPVDFSRIYGFVYLTVDVAMIWFLLSGLMDVAKRESNRWMFQRASNLRVAYLLVMCLVASSRAVWGISRDLGPPYMVFLIISTLVLLLLILSFIHRSKSELAFRR